MKTKQTEDGKRYYDAGIKGSEHNGEIPQTRNQATIDNLLWANEMMRREIWVLKKRLSQYEEVSN
jgi:hypothetical protein